MSPNDRSNENSVNFNQPLSINSLASRIKKRNTVQRVNLGFIADNFYVIGRRVFKILFSNNELAGREKYSTR